VYPETSNLWNLAGWADTLLEHCSRYFGRKDGLNMATGKRNNDTTQAVSISMASKITGVEVHTLRYWEKEFDASLDPIRTTGGQRRYRPEDIQTVFTIKRLLRDEMFSIAGARKYLAKSERNAA